MDNQAVVQAIEQYVRPQTFPLAIKLGRKGEEPPPRARWPKKDLGVRVPVCQAIGIARRYGWTMALRHEDQSCPFGSLALGFLPPKEGYLDGSFYESVLPGYGEQQAGFARALYRLPYGEYEYVAVSPVARAAFSPDLLVLYGNAAQVMRMVQGAVWKRGGVVTATAAGRGYCADVLVQPLKTGDCHFALPCNGDRIFGAAQDDEMAFASPWEKVPGIMEGLKLSHDSGLQRYPVTTFLRYEPHLPKDYYQLFEFLEKE